VMSFGGIFFSSRRRLRRPSTGILRIPSLNSHRAVKVHFECTRSETERKSGIRTVPDIVPDLLALTEKTLGRCYDVRKPRTFCVGPFCRKGLCLVGPFCRKGSSICRKANPSAYVDQHSGLLRFISFTQVAASREVLLGKEDLQKRRGIFRACMSCCVLHRLLDL
jgi:hypothetical protein